MSSQVSWNKNLVLAVALCALGGFAYWLEVKHKPETESAEEATKKVFSLKDAQIESIQIVDGAKKFQLNCLDLQAKTCKPGDNSKWQLTEPLQARADDSNTNSFVSSLSNLTSSETIDLKQETPEKRKSLMNEYGLSPEALQGASAKRVDVKASNGETVIYLGSTNPINENVFAIAETVPSGQKPTGKPDDTKVFQIPSYFTSNYSHDLTYWRDKKVLSLVASEIQSFEIRSKKNGTIQAERKDGGWIVTSGSTSFEGDSETINAILNGAAYLSAKSFVADSKTDAKAKSALKGSPELLSVTLYKAKGSAPEAPAPITLTLYSNRSESNAAPKPKAKGHDHDHDEGFTQGAKPDSTPVYATVSNADPLYELQANAPKQFAKELKDFRMTKLITSMDRFNTKKIEFSGKPIGDQPLSLVNKDTKWVDAKSQAEVNGDKVQTFFDKISGNRIKDFLTAATTPTGEQDGLKVTLGDDQNPTQHQFIFWKNDGKLYARNLGSAKKEAFLVDSVVTDGLPWDRDYFRK
jgi:hypothetical protein